MTIRILTTLLTLCLVCGCSFDDTFFPVDKRPDDGTSINQENIVLKSVDGKNIHHILIKPQSNPKATIFVFHGSGSKVANWKKLLKPLLQDGYQLFLMEYRGFGNSEGDASHETVAADALVTEGTFTSFRNIAVYSTPWIGKQFTWTFFLNPYSSVKLIQEVAMPILIIHSQEDDVVPFFMGEELFDHAWGYKEFWKIHGKHTDALVDYPKEFVVRINKIAGLAHNP